MFYDIGLWLECTRTSEISDSAGLVTDIYVGLISD